MPEVGVAATLGQAYETGEGKFVYTIVCAVGGSVGWKTRLLLPRAWLRSLLRSRKLLAAHLFMNKPPAFQIYPKDIFSDIRCMVMSNECFGIYIKLLLFDWIEDGLPNDPSIWLDLVHHLPPADDPEPAEQYKKVLAQMFIKHPKRRGYVTNKKLLEYRKSLSELSVKRAESGRLGGLSKRQANAKQEPSSSVFSLQSSSSIKKSFKGNGKTNEKTKKAWAVPPSKDFYKLRDELAGKKNVRK